MPFAVNSGQRIYWKAEGRNGAPPLVLLNSIGTDMDLWSEMLPALRRRFLVLRIDTRGHGASAAPDEDYDLPLLADDVVAVLEAAGVATAAIAGVSLGAMIAMQLAIDQPGRVSRLALICTSATMDSSAWAARVDLVRGKGLNAIVDMAMARFLSAEFAARRPEVTETVRRGLTTMSAAGYAGAGAAIRDMDLAYRISRIACPTLVVSGAYDASTPFEGHGSRLIDAIPNAAHAEVPTGHLAPLEAPKALSAALIGFFCTGDDSANDGGRSGLESRVVN